MPTVLGRELKLDASSDRCQHLGQWHVWPHGWQIAGDWHLPNIRELVSLIDYGDFDPALTGGPSLSQRAERGGFDLLDVDHAHIRRLSRRG